MNASAFISASAGISRPLCDVLHDYHY